jgi:flagellar biosynthesis protein FlhF
MQIKSFTARGTKEVLSLIKAELGPDAVILDTQEEDGLITMTAALERTPSRKTPADGMNGPGAAPSAEHPGAARRGGARAEDGGKNPEYARPTRNAAARPRGVSPAATPASAAPGQGATPAFRTPAQAHAPKQSEASGQGAAAAFRASAHAHAPRQSAAAASWAHAPGRPAVALSSPAYASGDAYAVGPSGPQRWQEEWSGIKQQLMDIIRPAASLDVLPPRQRLAVEFLRREGVEEAALVQLCNRLHGDPATSILVPLGDLVPICSWNGENWLQRIQVIAGPFGAGKTTVAVRLALALRKSRPGIRICLLNADAGRGNGRLLLRHYCELSDMAYKEASTTLELVAALNQGLREGFDRIIADLPGFSRGRRLRTLLDDAGLSSLTGGGPEDLAVHLALSPHYREMRGMMERYRTAHRTGIVWTKLDEAEHFGQMVNVGAATGLPVSALSFGPGLGNSLASAKENMLWRLIFKREMPPGA